MKTIEMIYRVTCRHCRQAFGLIEELRRSNEKYEKIEMRFLDTERDKELLEDRKFTYVPCFYIEGEMVMEGEDRGGIRTGTSGYKKQSKKRHNLQ